MWTSLIILLVCSEAAQFCKAAEKINFFAEDSPEELNEKIEQPSDSSEWVTESEGENEDRVCYDCSSASNINCGKRLNRVRSFCDLKEADYCYTFVENDITTRGCLHDLPQNLQNKCKDGSNGCEICSDSKCNNVPITGECYTCNSKDTLECASGSLPRSFLRKCKAAMSECVVGIDKDGFTHRGCLDDFPKPLDDVLPLGNRVCDTDRCNKKYPKERLSCYQCAESAECNDVLNNSRTEALSCRIYSAFEHCYTFMDEDENGLDRGCISDATESRIKCQANIGSCEMCDEDGCNHVPHKSEPQLECIICSDDKECAFGHDMDSEQTCEKDVMFGQNETCFTRIGENGVVYRGCTLDKARRNPNWCEEDEHCTECDDPGCNSINAKLSSCIECNSLEKKDCGNPMDIYSYSTYCELQHVPYLYEESGCYSAKTREAGVVRGCVKDLSEAEVEYCQTSSSQCKICMGSDCNTDGYSSARTLTSQLTTLACAFVAIRAISKLFI